MIARHPVAIGVPVRDEAALLPRLLAALAAQQRAPGFTLCIMLDGCSDDSAAVIDRHRAGVPFEIVTQSVARADPNAGRARAAAMALTMARVEHADGIVLSTDADSVPAPDWIATNIAALEQCDVAAGRIVRDTLYPNPLQDRIETYYDALFALRRAIDPVPWEAVRTHHYTSGASLGVRASVYAALGGFEPLPSAEDARLVDAAHRAGYRVRRDDDIRATTSSRREGRAWNGLADHLRRLDEGHAAATMAHPADVAWRYHGHAAARAAWSDLARHGPALAARIGRSRADIDAIAADAPNAEAFATRVVPDIPGGERLVTLDTAERALTQLDTRAVAA